MKRCKTCRYFKNKTLCPADEAVGHENFICDLYVPARLCGDCIHWQNDPGLSLAGTCKACNTSREDCAAACIRFLRKK